MVGRDRLDAVELKVFLSPDQALTAGIWGADAEGDLVGHVWFCERSDVTPDRLPLMDAGVILRLRETRQCLGTTTAELCPCRRSRVSGPWPLRVEAQWTGERRVLSASLTAAFPESAVADVVARGGPPRQLFTARQRRFLDECADCPVDIGDLRVLGPVSVHHWPRRTWTPADLNVERWQAGTDTGARLDFVELSRRVDRLLKALLEVPSPDPGPAPESPYRPLPGGANLRVTIRRTVRVGALSGTPVEDLGVLPDVLHHLTRDDLLHDNTDLLAHGRTPRGPALLPAGLGDRRAERRADRRHGRARPRRRLRRQPPAHLEGRHRRRHLHRSAPGAGRRDPCRRVRRGSARRRTDRAAMMRRRPPDSAATPDHIRGVYQEICLSYRAIDDFRARLLGLLPVISGAGVCLLLGRGPGPRSRFGCP